MKHQGSDDKGTNLQRQGLHKMIRDKILSSDQMNVSYVICIYTVCTCTVANIMYHIVSSMFCLGNMKMKMSNSSIVGAFNTNSLHTSSKTESTIQYTWY